MVTCTTCAELDLDIIKPGPLYPHVVPPFPTGREGPKPVASEDQMRFPHDA